MILYGIKQAGGASYSSIGAYLNGLPVSYTEEIIGEVQDSSVYDNNVEAFPLTPPSDGDSINHGVLRVSAATSKKGNPNNVGASVVMNDTDGAHAFHLIGDYFELLDFDIDLATPTTSNEAIRLEALNGVRISRNIIRTDTTVVDCDGIYTGAWDINSAFVSQNLIIGFPRSGCNWQNVSASAANDQTIHMDLNTIVNCGSAGEAESGGVHAKARHTVSTTTIHAYNNFCGGTASIYPDWNEDGAGNDSGNVFWVGSNNSSEDASVVGLLPTNAISGVTINVTNFSNPAANDFRVPGIGSALFGAGLDRVGSEPGVTQDFGFDITRNPRTALTPNVGAFGAGAATLGGGDWSVSVAMSGTPGLVNVLGDWSFSATLNGNPALLLNETADWSVSVAMSGAPGLANVLGGWSFSATLNGNPALLLNETADWSVSVAMSGAPGLANVLGDWLFSATLNGNPALLLSETADWSVNVVLSGSPGLGQLVPLDIANPGLYNLTPDLAVKVRPITQFAGRDNVTVFVVASNGVDTDLTPLTKVQLILSGDAGAIVLDSAVDAGVFSWAGSLITVALGDVLVAGRYNARLVLFDAVNTNGIVWGDDFQTIVK